MVETMDLSEEQRLIWKRLQDVKDPEIPVVSIVDLGLVRQVEIEGDRARIRLTPTFAGCPAIDVIQQQVEAAIEAMGYDQVEVELVLSPPWSTDMMTAAARRQLADFGLSPPPIHGGQILLLIDDPAACPYCGSSDTERKNDFGSALCRSIHYCRSCQQPFESFKPL